MKTNYSYVRRWGLVLMCLAVIPAGIVSCRDNTLKTDATGIFESTEVVVSAETGGKLCRLEVEEGDALQPLQEVGLVDTVSLSLKRAGLEASKSALFNQRTDVPKQVAATRRQIERAQIEVGRLRDLVARGAGTQQHLDDAEAQLGVLRRQLEAQLSTLTTGNRAVDNRQQATGYQIAELDDQIRRCHIKAPMAGVVLTKYAEAGEVVGTGSPLFRMADLKRVFLRAYVPGAVVSRLKLGQKATVYADDGSEGYRRYAGRVTWISDQAEFTPKTIQTRDERANLVYAVKIAVKNDGAIKLGMYGEVVFK